ncbi:methylenetetrahydrofolate reductase [NAD(P)H] [Sanyastnella coralliicola]|uniref:methylenetetrahydrofolate reductase [NAD(P)H] n=1 Tax=Sanyastnella coralliicola TaxID=3069118 RepID=UPI0027B87F35|nr:methylenetetrahydrofolate reductase [NAD(P)H] [Longitalea sp. SCSIO 12813]
MKVIDHIKGAKKTLFSVEVLPPLKGQDINSIFTTMDNLMEFEPAFVDVTYHREEYVYREVKEGLLEKKTVRKRPGTVGICAALKHRYSIDPVPHIICGGFRKEETENALIDLNFLGIDNVLVLRGDPIRSEGRFKAEDDGHAYAIDLLHQVVDLNNGIYLDPDLRNTNKTDFCAGVAGYPEKHFEAPNIKSDLRYLKQKVDDGAEYIVTQMFFDNQAYFDYVKLCRENGINVPIIPGIKPLTSARQLVSIPQNFYVNLPEELVDNVEACKSKEEVKEAGIEWCIRQCKELMEFGVPVLHFYTMGKSEVTARVAKEVF